MFKLIGGVFKYSFLVLVILVLSHIIQIRGVTISQYVDYGINTVSGVAPKGLFHSPSEIANLKADLASSLQDHTKQLNEAADLSISAEDQKKLDHLIQKSENKK